MKIDNRDIFEQIGNLFYAIAAEQHVKPLEVAELKLLISNDWLPRVSTSLEPLVSEDAHYILMTMDSLQGAGALARAAFKDFETFFRNHEELFTNELKKRILKTALDIVKVFKADNKSSNLLFEEVKSLLQISKPIVF